MGKYQFPIIYLLSMLLLFVSFVDMMTLENTEELQSREEVESCLCYFLYKPVCGTDGNVYENCCFLKCAKKRKPALLPVCFANDCKNCNATNTNQIWGPGGTHDC